MAERVDSLVLVLLCTVTACARPGGVITLAVDLIQILISTIVLTRSQALQGSQLVTCKRVCAVVIGPMGAELQKRSTTLTRKQ